MQKSILIKILKTCTKKEFRDLHKWMASPMHNQRKDVAKLFGYLMEDNHLYNDDFLEKEAAYKWIFPKEAFDDAKMRQTMHFTTKCIEEFLIYQELLDDAVNARIALAKALRKRKLSKPFEKQLRDTQKIQKNQAFRNGQFLRNEYFIQQEQYYYFSGINRLEFNLQEMADALDSMYYR